MAEIFIIKDPYKDTIIAMFTDEEKYEEYMEEFIRGEWIETDTVRLVL